MMSRSYTTLLLLVASLAMTGLSASGDVAINKFRADLEARDQALAAFGIDYFTTVEQTGSKTATVTVTEAWVKAYTDGAGNVTDKQGHIQTLLDSWWLSNGADTSGNTLIIVSPAGTMLTTVTK